jgi:hypothetical protein
MRTFLLAVLGAAVVAAPAAAATRNFGINGFDKVRVEGPYKVRLANGVAPYARALGSAAALDRVSVEVQGRTLIVHPNRSGWGGYPGLDAGPVEIEVGTHELSSALLNGSGAVAIGRADVDQLNIAIGGTASAVIAGRAAKTTAVLRGISSLDASGLTSKDAAFGAEGSATIKAIVTNSVKIDASGPATITLAGKPACTVRANGSLTLTGCKSTQ